ncbi:A disintegrin and metalloproteinase with thrombospondin motifs adt-2-like [Linepithema humile]|uniref:A disintegrin and metalloproteinase with thrombospondin motifs adt-2-like n=1 Tax=Linepithema humile TaxID=83485 RepID=UPI00351F5033
MQIKYISKTIIYLFKSLGMRDDSDPFHTTCPKGEYIMTDWLYYRGQITWSECSRNSAKKLWRTKQCLLDRTRRENTEDPYALDHSRYHDLPGREWTVKAKCELFLQDNDANVVTLHDIYQVLQCKIFYKNKYFFAGPALDGTYCAFGKECRRGKCVPALVSPYNFRYCERDKWSEWTKYPCKSSCLNKSKSVRVKRRVCRHRIHKTANCKGSYYDVVLCDDSTLCTKRRQKIAEYTTMKCSEFSLEIEKYKRSLHYHGKKFKYGSLNKPVVQASHIVREPWRACTIHCLREEKISDKHSLLHFYAPRQEMLDLGIDPYFPDGTWCHEKNGLNYYCRQHYCLPENYSIEE